MFLGSHRGQHRRGPVGHRPHLRQRQRSVRLAAHHPGPRVPADRVRQPHVPRVAPVVGEGEQRGALPRCQRSDDRIVFRREVGPPVALDVPDRRQRREIAQRPVRDDEAARPGVAGGTGSLRPPHLSVHMTEQCIGVGVGDGLGSVGRVQSDRGELLLAPSRKDGQPFHAHADHLRAPGFPVPDGGPDGE